jgi:hypothetical protein
MRKAILTLLATSSGRTSLGTGQFSMSQKIATGPRTAFAWLFVCEYSIFDLDIIILLGSDSDAIAFGESEVTQLAIALSSEDIMLPAYQNKR